MTASCSPAFLDTLRGAIAAHLEHPEARVRSALAACLQPLAAREGPAVWEALKAQVLRSVEANFDRDAAAAARGEQQQQQQQADAGVGSDEEEGPDTSLFAAKPRKNPELAALRHDTEGWKSLETSFSAVRFIMKGCRERFNPHLDEALLQLVFRSVRHRNRFVRETGFLTCGTIAEICGPAKLEAVSDTLTRILGTGLGDNWSQVRFAASVAARKYLEHAEGFRERYYERLLPAMCLNRYYVAEGVRLYSIETWRRVMGAGAGPALVAAHIGAVVAYYVSQSEADNHAVREAACHCTAELGLKVDREAVRPHVAELLRALMVCFRDESWPVRDAACGACGNFVSSFPEEGRAALPELYELWFQHLADNIPSVRQGSAAALGKVLRAYGDEAFAVVMPRVVEMLPRAKEQRPDSRQFSGLSNVTQFGVAPPARRVGPSEHAHDSEHTDQTMFSCGSLAPKMRRGGGCMDHSFRREPEAWEASHGAIYMVAEVSAIRPELAGPLLPTVADVAMQRHYKHHAVMFETVWRQVPVIARNMGARAFKPFLDELLDPLFVALRCGNRLAMNAAGEAAGFFAAFVGPAVFLARLTDTQRRELEQSPFVDPIRAEARAGPTKGRSGPRSAPPRI